MSQTGWHRESAGKNKVGNTTLLKESEKTPETSVTHLTTQGTQSCRQDVFESLEYGAL